MRRGRRGAGVGRGFAQEGLVPHAAVIGIALPLVHEADSVTIDEHLDVPHVRPRAAETPVAPGHFLDRLKSDVGRRDAETVCEVADGLFDRTAVRPLIVRASTVAIHPPTIRPARAE